MSMAFHSVTKRVRSLKLIPAGLVLAEVLPKFILSHSVPFCPGQHGQLQSVVKSGFSALSYINTYIYVCIMVFSIVFLSYCPSVRGFSRGWW
jgi:hypothetical protein